MRKSPLTFSTFVVLLFLSIALNISFAEDWPTFRGPTGQGLTVEQNLPLTFSETENIAWKTDLPGKGWSSPVFEGRQLWLSTAVEEKPTPDQAAEKLKSEKNPKQKQIANSISLRALCVDKESGKELKNIELELIKEPESIHALNSYASPTPVVHEGHVYFHFGTYGTFCVREATGDIVWKKRLPLQHAVGPGSSPVVVDNLLILTCDGMETQYVTALHCETGETAWKTERPEMAGSDGDLHKAFSTPLVVKWDGTTQIVIPGAQWFVSYEVDSGNMLWQINHGKGFSNVAAPIHANGIAYLITGFTKPELWAMPLNQRGELNRQNVLWEQKKQVPKKSTPQWTKDGIYMVSDSGVLSCVNLDSGELNWSARLGGNYSASPIHCRGRIYFASHEGVVTVVKPNSEKFEKLAENQLDGQIMASPAADHSALFVRTDKALYRIEE